MALRRLWANTNAGGYGSPPEPVIGPAKPDPLAGTTHMMRSAIPAPPLKQRGGKIRRITLHLHKGRRRVRERDRLDHLAIEVPGGVAEQRDHDCQAKKER